MREEEEEDNKRKSKKGTCVEYIHDVQFNQDLNQNIFSSAPATRKLITWKFSFLALKETFSGDIWN